MSPEVRRLISVCIAILVIAILTSTVSANLLVNPGFEDAGLGGGDVFGAPGWSDFGANVFTVHTSLIDPVGALSGTHAFKEFGACCSGIFQQFPAKPGQTWNAGVNMLNFSGDQMANGQVGAINIEWIKADGNNSDILPFISNGTFTAADAPVDEWTFQPITGVAPADAAFARLVLITGDFQPGGPGGAVFFDEAFIELIPEPGTITLIALGMLGIFGVRRRS